MKIILCITGSIAATEDLKLIHQLQRHDHEVEVFMTESATEIITPLSMEFASKNPVTVNLTGKVEHVVNAQADLILVAPATANTITKFANKIADTSVTTLLLTASGYETPILFVPSMHISMYKAIESSIEQIKKEHPYVQFLQPREAERKAKFPSIHDIVLECERMTSEGKLEGKNILVATGATYEPIDAMRGITNRSSGKMGVEIAKEAYRQKANVLLVCGRTHAHIPKILPRMNIETTKEMMDLLKEKIPEMDIYVSVAAISDFTIDNVREDKIPSDGDITVTFTKLPKVLEQIKKINPSIYTVGFKAEAGVTDDVLIEKATKRMDKYDVDLMVANDILVENSGPDSVNNEVILLQKDKSPVKIPLTTKYVISTKIIDEVSKGV